MNKYIRTSLAGLMTSTMITGAAFAAGTHPETGEALAEDQTFIYRLGDEHSSVDPQVVEDTYGAEITRDLFEGLMNQDEDGNLVPGVATGYTTNDTKDVYTFTLRDNAKWSNGDPVTAQDFVWSFQRALHPRMASQVAQYLVYLEGANEYYRGENDDPDSLGIEAIDDQGLVVDVRHRQIHRTHHRWHPHRPRQDGDMRIGRTRYRHDPREMSLRNLRQQRCADLLTHQDSVLGEGLPTLSSQLQLRQHPAAKVAQIGGALADVFVVHHLGLHPAKILDQVVDAR